MKPDRALINRLQRSITALHRLLRRQNLPMTPAQHSIVTRLVETGPVTVSALAAAEQVSAATVSRMLDTLESSDLVRRARDKRDRRVVYAVATREGATLSRLAVGAQSPGESLGRLSKADQEALSQALETIERILQAREGESGQ